MTQQPARSQKYAFQGGSGSPTNVSTNGPRPPRKLRRLQSAPYGKIGQESAPTISEIRRLARLEIDKNVAVTAAAQVQADQSEPNPDDMIGPVGGDRPNEFDFDAITDPHTPPPRDDPDAYERGHAQHYREDPYARGEYRERQNVNADYYYDDGYGGSKLHRSMSYGRVKHVHHHLHESVPVPVPAGMVSPTTDWPPCPPSHVPVTQYRELQERVWRLEKLVQPGDFGEGEDELPPREPTLPLSSGASSSGYSVSQSAASLTHEKRLTWGDDVVGGRLCVWHFFDKPSPRSKGPPKKQCAIL